jgi:hypothetical protein
LRRLGLSNTIQPTGPSTRLSILPLIRFRPESP